METKTVNGQLSDARVEKHAELHDQYGLHAHVLRESPPALVTEARRVVGLLRDCQQGRAGVTSEQPKQTAPHAFQVLILPRPWADGIAAHLGGDVAADGGVQVAGAAFAHGGDDLLGRKGSFRALTTQLAGDSENFVTASHASIVHGLQEPRRLCPAPKPLPPRLRAWPRHPLPSRQALDGATWLG